MRKITLSKIEIKEIEVLQDELNTFILNKSALMLACKNTDQYFSELLLMAIAQRIYYFFRKVIENATKVVATLKFDAEEAIILMQVCADAKPNDQFHNYAMKKFIKLFHEELTNLI